MPISKDISQVLDLDAESIVLQLLHFHTSVLKKHGLTRQNCYLMHVDCIDEINHSTEGDHLHFSVEVFPVISRFSLKTVSFTTLT